MGRYTLCDVTQSKVLQIDIGLSSYSSRLNQLLYWRCSGSSSVVQMVFRYLLVILRVTLQWLVHTETNCMPQLHSHGQTLCKLSRSESMEHCILRSIYIVFGVACCHDSLSCHAKLLCQNMNATWHSTSICYTVGPNQDLDCIVSIVSRLRDLFCCWRSCINRRCDKLLPTYNSPQEGSTGPTQGMQTFFIKRNRTAGYALLE